jgi:hypothetical protein
VLDIPAYLRDRRPVLDYRSERPLFMTLPDMVRAEIDEMAAAFDLVTGYLKAHLSVQAACRRALTVFKNRWPLKTFRAKYDLFVSTRDWLSLVNRSKAGSPWQQHDDGLPAAFITFCAARMGRYIRDDAKREALRSIKRQWRTGRDRDGNTAPIPGYEKIGPTGTVWSKRNPEIYPVGWSYSNIMRQVKARNAFPRSVQALLHESTSAATAYLPQVHSTRATLHFLEEVQFDDVKTDFVIFDPRTGETMDLWLLVAHDVATTILLGFGMRPARAREDGSQEHLKLRDMKQLAGWLLERFGLPPYPMRWKVEQGTATFSAGSQAALQELLDGRLQLSFSSMLGGKSPAGYAERAKGNSRGKASLESHNRLLHIIGADLPGQTGPVYGKRPADLLARRKECEQIWSLTRHLPDHLRGQVGYSLLTLAQARTELTRIFHLRNSRTEHTLESFSEILEWFDSASGQWQPQSSFPGSVASVTSCKIPVRRRMESPIERAARLCLGLQFTPISPDIITAFYEHTQRPVTITPAGQIEFQHEGRQLLFVSGQPSNNSSLYPGCKALAYFHPDDPARLYLTNGKGSILGVWLRQNLVNDRESLAEAIRHNTAALNAARAYAHDLNAPERQRLDDMRARNSELLDSANFIEVSGREAFPSTLNSQLSTPLASAFTSIAEQRKASKQRIRAESETESDARANLRKAAQMF